MVQDHDDAGGDDLWLRVRLDPCTIARLHNLADLVRADPVAVAASLLHDILRDDDLAHSPHERAMTFN
jgi:hypothetical protein